LVAVAGLFLFSVINIPEPPGVVLNSPEQAPVGEKEKIDIGILRPGERLDKQGKAKTP
jgi:hypothetical protein